MRRSSFFIPAIVISLFVGCGVADMATGSDDEAPTLEMGGASGSSGEMSGWGGSDSEGGSGGSGAGGSTGSEVKSPSSACRACLLVECASASSVCDAQPACADCLNEGPACGVEEAKYVLDDCGCSLCGQLCADSFLDCKDGVGLGGSSSGSGGSPGGSSGNGGSPGSSEQCTNGVDDDENGLIDCQDPACIEACDDACLAPPSLLIGVTTSGSTAAHADQFSPACFSHDETGADVVYVVEPPQAGMLTITLSSAHDLGLSLRQSCAPGLADLVCADAVGAGGSEQISIEVRGGERLYVLVGGARGEDAGAFSLKAELSEVTCGDGVRAASEECDDGNTLDGDGCSSACAIEACLSDAETIALGEEPVLIAGDTSAAGASPVLASCSLLGASAPSLVYRVQAEQAGRVEARLESEADLLLSVRGACTQSDSERVCVDGAQAGGVERLSTTVQAGESLFLIVGGYAQDAGAFSLKLRNVRLACGDGVVSGVEQCDALVPEPAEPLCSSECVYTIPDGPTESEPNELPSQQRPYVDGVMGRVWPAGDVDVYRVEVAQGEVLTVDVDDRLGDGPARGACEAEHQDSYVELLGADGETVLGRDDDSGEGLCARLVTAPLSEGSYYLRVSASPTFSPDSVFTYRLAVARQAP